MVEFESLIRTPGESSSAGTEARDTAVNKVKVTAVTDVSRSSDV